MGAGAEQQTASPSPAVPSAPLHSQGSLLTSPLRSLCPEQPLRVGTTEPVAMAGGGWLPRANTPSSHLLPAMTSESS